MQSSLTLDPPSAGLLVCWAAGLLDLRNGLLPKEPLSPSLFRF